MIPDIALHVLSYLQFYQLAEICAVSKEWKSLAEDGTMWKPFYLYYAPRYGYKVPTKVEFWKVECKLQKDQV